ncbi:MAG: DUF4062 domain-containing protein [Flavobacterium sp.]
MSPRSKLIKPKLLVASTIYGYEDQLSSIYAQLSSYGYDFLNSHMGTVLANPSKSNLESCLDAVKECDAILGIIRPTYGSGVLEDGGLSITHQEIRLAIALNKARWFLAHRDVIFARQLLKKISCTGVHEGGGAVIKVAPSSSFDVRSIDVYNEVIKSSEPPAERIGHWAQEFYRFDEMLAFIRAQFEDIDKVVAIIKAMKHE